MDAPPHASREQWITLVLARSGELRAAGVTSIRCGDMEATFSASPPPVDTTPRPKPKEIDDRDWLSPGGIPDVAPGKPTTDEDDEEPLWNTGDGGAF